MVHEVNLLRDAILKAFTRNPDLISFSLCYLKEYIPKEDYAKCTYLVARHDEILCRREDFIRGIDETGTE